MSEQQIPKEMLQRMARNEQIGRLDAMLASDGDAFTNERGEVIGTRDGATRERASLLSIGLGEDLDAINQRIKDLKRAEPIDEAALAAAEAEREPIRAELEALTAIIEA